jgi:hypothetical protein
MDGNLSRRQREDQPAFARVHPGEPEDVAEERAGRFSVLGEEDRVGARDHRTDHRPPSVHRLAPQIVRTTRWIVALPVAVRA